MEWEGAELCYYINGESHGIDLSDTQFAIVAKILGLEINPDGSVNCFLMIRSNASSEWTATL